VKKPKKKEKPKKSVTELVLGKKKGAKAAEIKEVIKESPPPADKVVASKAAVKNLFRSFKRKTLKKRLKKRRKDKRSKSGKQGRAGKKLNIPKEEKPEPKPLEMETAKSTREGKNE